MQYKVKWGEEAFWVGLGTIIGGAVVAIARLCGVEVDEDVSKIIVGAIVGLFAMGGRLLLGTLLPTPDEPTDGESDA